MRKLVLASSRSLSLTWMSRMNKSLSKRPYHCVSRRLLWKGRARAGRFYRSTKISELLSLVKQTRSDKMIKSYKNRAQLRDPKNQSLPCWVQPREKQGVSFQHHGFQVNQYHILSPFSNTQWRLNWNRLAIVIELSAKKANYVWLRTTELVEWTLSAKFS